MDYEFLYDGKTYSVTVESGEGNFKVTVGDRAFDVNASMMSRGILSMIIEGRSVLVRKTAVVPFGST